MKQNNAIKRSVLRVIALTVCIFPPAIATISYFPVWVVREDTSVLSGMALLVLTIVLIPLMKYIKEKMESPSAPVIWMISFLLFFLLSKIATEMTIISLIGFISNLIGTLIFKLADKITTVTEEK